MLRSEATSDVLFSLMRGKRTPKEIADDIGDTPTSVVEQLNRLREAGYVVRTEKEGKLQPYEIMWKSLLRDAISHAGLLYDGYIVAIHQGETTDIPAALKKNEQLLDFLKRYLFAIATRESRVDVYLRYSYRFGGWWSPKISRALEAAMYEFELSLLQSFPTLDESQFKAKEKADLYNALKTWYQLSFTALQKLVMEPYLRTVEELVTAP